jgi:glucokinase
MLLAGDVGATKTLVGLFAPGRGRPEPVEVQAFPTLAHPSLEAIVDAFLARQPGGRPEIDAATFGVAGPIVDRVARLTNVPWSVDADQLRRRFTFPRVGLLNDLEAMAFSVESLRPDELEVLQEGRRAPAGNAALIAAGTGLGEALLHRVGGWFVPSATEGGHADFAPRTGEEIALLERLARDYGRVSYERVLSGPGLVNVWRFTHDAACAVVDEAADPATLPSLISASALGRRCRDCARALDLFVAVYGAEAGNLALRSMATAGLFVGGGIAPKILPALRSGAFMEAFRAKAPLAGFVASVTVAVILNDRAALLGAAVHASLEPAA